MYSEISNQQAGSAVPSQDWSEATCMIPITESQKPTWWKA